MDRIIRETEVHRWSSAGREGFAQRLRFSERPTSGSEAGSMLRPGQTETVNPQRDVHFEIPDIVCGAAVEAAVRLDGAPIVAFSQGGFTARMIARYRPQRAGPGVHQRPPGGAPAPTGLGRSPGGRRAVDPGLDEVVAYSTAPARGEAGAAGRPIVILMGDPIRDRPLTNLMRVHRVRKAK